jgi:hypothetical protein
MWQDVRSATTLNARRYYCRRAKGSDSADACLASTRMNENNEAAAELHKLEGDAGKERRSFSVACKTAQCVHT